MFKTVADIIVESLSNLGVERIYGVVGDSLNGITDAILRNKQIAWVHTRHEEVAAFAAGAEAQLTGKLAVCAGSCGPGNLHLINGLFDAHRSKAPVLAIAAHIPTQEIGRQYFQETHPQVLFKECSSYCEMVSSPEQIPDMLALAIQSALSNSGVAVLVISGDIALAKSQAQPISWPRMPAPIIVPSPDELQQLVSMLDAERITVLCGRGCAGAHQELMQLCATLQAPMVHALRGKEHVEYDNPYDIGMTGFIGFSSGYYAMEDCETLLMLGTSFPYRQFYPSKARIIQIDISGEALGRHAKLDLGLVGDIKETLRALLPMLKPRANRTFLDKAVKHYQVSRKNLDLLAQKDTVIHPQYLARCVNDIALENAIFTCDVGTPTIWAARYLTMNGKRRLLGSFNHGSMANALAQAIGAQASHSKQQVIALCGDGGFTMLMGDLLTLVQENLPVKVVIFNNGSLGFVEMEMKANGFLNFGTDLKNPNFAAMANAMGIYAKSVTNAYELTDALAEVFSRPGPGLIDVVTNRFELSLPPKIKFDQVKGFSLYLLKALLNGKGTELMKMTKTNLWR